MGWVMIPMFQIKQKILKLKTSQLFISNLHNQ